MSATGDPGPCVEFGPAVHSVIGAPASCIRLAFADHRCARRRSSVPGRWPGTARRSARPSAPPAPCTAPRVEVALPRKGGGGIRHTNAHQGSAVARHVVAGRVDARTRRTRSRAGGVDRDRRRPDDPRPRRDRSNARADGARRTPGCSRPNGSPTADPPPTRSGGSEPEPRLTRPAGAAGPSTSDSPGAARAGARGSRALRSSTMSYGPSARRIARRRSSTRGRPRPSRAKSSTRGPRRPTRSESSPRPSTGPTSRAAGPRLR